jgi:hypothetical protein
MGAYSKGTKAKNEVLRTYDTSVGDSTFQAVGDPLANPARIIKWKNDSNVDVTISFDGTNDHDIILAGDREVEDLTANKTIEEGLLRGRNTQIYASSAAGTGNLYLTVIYAENT